MTALGDHVPEVNQQHARCPCGAEFLVPCFGKPTPEPKTATCDTCRQGAARLARRTVEVKSRAERERRAVAVLEVPDIYATATLEHFELHGTEAEKRTQQRALTVAQRWVGTWPEAPSLQVWRGGPGTGKGHLVWAITRLLYIECDVPGRVVKLADMIRELRAGWRSRSADAEELVLERYRKLRWLAIDEVSTHAFRGEPKQHLYDVVDHRLEHRRPTILTSNEEPAELAALLGPALVSRINGSGGIIDFGSADYRARART